MIHHTICPLCSSENISAYLTCIDHLISKEAFEIYTCSSCGFEFTREYPEEEAIGRYYESTEYVSHSDTSKGFSNKIYRFVRNIMLQKKKRFIRRVTGLYKGALLDIGSGTGYFANTMKNAGWNVKGIEINEKARDYSCSKFGLEVTGPDMIAALQPASFDCITLWHVLEHFHDPFRYASDIFHLLKPEGVCIIALPNSSSYDAEYYKNFWAAWDVPRHLWHFNPATFRLFSKKTGFSLTSVSNLPLDVFYISSLSEKYRGSKLSFIKGIVRACIFAFHSVFRKEKSSSVIYILKKPASA